MNGLSLGCVNTRRASLDRVLLLYVFHLLTFGEQELTPSRRAQSSSFDSLLFLQDLLSISLFLFHSFSWVQQSSSFNFLSVSVFPPSFTPRPDSELLPSPIPEHRTQKAGTSQVHLQWECSENAFSVHLKIHLRDCTFLWTLKTHISIMPQRYSEEYSEIEYSERESTQA